MNSLNLLRPAIKAIAMLMVLGSMIFVTSCKDSEDPTFPAPTLTVNPTTTEGLPGAKVTTSVIVDSPAGGKTLTTMVNGSATNAPAAVPLDGTESQTVSVDFTIPASAQVGNVYTLSFQSTDNNDQLSQVAFFTVTVSATPAKEQVMVSTDIVADTHWTADKIYVLTKLINVGTDTKDAPGKSAPSIKATAVLTIDPGTVILGQTGTPGGGLIIHRGSKIIANGTAAAPIVFTAEDGDIKKPGLWGGLVLCGQASNNNNAVVELEGAYGGWHSSSTPKDDDNSGSLTYVRVEFAGYPINPNQEINGITFGSVGSGTTVHHVQVSYSADDSFEWFGGTMNANSLISYKAQDDDFDTDNGFTGKVQFGIAIRDAQLADQSGSNGFESDNDANGSTNTPITAPVFSNMTIIGGKQAANTSISSQFQNGAHIRRSSKLSLINSFITGFPTGIFIDGTQGTAVTNAANGDLKLRNNILAGVKSWGGNYFGTAASTDEQDAFKAVTGATWPAGSNHPNPPRGRIFAAGTIPSGTNPYINGVFTVNEVQINSTNGLPWFLTPDTGNKLIPTWDDAKLGISASVFEPLSGAPTLVPTGDSMKTGAKFDGFTGLESVDFIGAFGGAKGDWTTTWSNWNPATTDYSK